MNRKILTIALGIGVGLICPTVQARHHIWVDPFWGDPFFDTPFIEYVLDFHDRASGSVRNYIEGFGPSKEEREALKVARESMSKIKHEVKEDENSVKIEFTGFEGLDKKDIKVVKKNSFGWSGTITLKQGRIEFFVSPRSVYVSRRIELKEEVKADPKNKDAKPQERVVYSSASATEDYFKSPVDVGTLKAQPVKATEFVLTVDKKKEKEEVLPLT